ncbi:MAG: hypothetical protein IPL08_18155 [Saprospiraceae bacterium]|nr:hypothetical protein [Saprospiraceae bacterium]
MTRSGFNDIRLQVQETMRRYDDYGMTVRQTISTVASAHKSTTDKIDEIITHRFLGPVFFFSLSCFLYFRLYFSWASLSYGYYRRRICASSVLIWINISRMYGGQTYLSMGYRRVRWCTGLCSSDCYFIFLIALLEESGYMSRVVFYV